MNLFVPDSLRKKLLRWDTYVFPIIPKTSSGFVHFLFWHSLILTASTPIARMISGKWMGIFTFESFLSLFGWETKGAVQPGVYLVYNQEASLDTGFSYHAFFGLLWLLVAFIQMGPLTKNIKLHRTFGYVIQFAFWGHLIASVSLLILDTQQHHWLPIFLLMSPVIRGSFCMIMGVHKARTGCLEQHGDYMFRCFIYSIEGAGTIRTVAYLLWLVGLGPTFCQSANGATATLCVAPYVLRLICIRLLSLYWIFCYAKMKNKPSFTKGCILELTTTIIFSTCAYVYAVWVDG